MSLPLVSVIVPNYNHQNYLEQRLESIFNQSFENFEVILLDDNSMDESLFILEKYSNDPKVADLLINESNSGSPFKQWEKGINLAKGKYIWIAESDDWAAHTFLEKMVYLLESNPDVGAVACRSEFVDEKGNMIEDYSLYRESFKRSGIEELTKFMAFRNSIHNASSVLFRQKLALPFPKEILKMKYCGDWIFWAHILTQSDFYFYNKQLNFFRRHEGNVSFSAEKEKLSIIEGIKICKIIFSQKEISRAEKKKILEYWWNKTINSWLDKKSRIANISRKIKLLAFLIACSPILSGSIFLKKIFSLPSRVKSNG